MSNPHFSDETLNKFASIRVIPSNMKPSRNIFSLIVLSAAFAVTASAASMTDYSAALELAAKENRPVLLEFTGSDWCPPCMMMKKQVLSQEAFTSFADDKLVFVELDFPRAKKQDAALVKQNQELEAKFGVQGYPTFILLDSAGKELGRTIGFMPGGPDAFIGWIKGKLKES